MRVIIENEDMTGYPYIKQINMPRNKEFFVLGLPLS